MWMWRRRPLVRIHSLRRRPTPLSGARSRRLVSWTARRSASHSVWRSTVVHIHRRFVIRRHRHTPRWRSESTVSRRHRRIVSIILVTISLVLGWRRSSSLTRITMWLRSTSSASLTIHRRSTIIIHRWSWSSSWARTVLMRHWRPSSSPIYVHVVHAIGEFLVLIEIRSPTLSRKRRERAGIRIFLFVRRSTAIH